MHNACLKVAPECRRDVASCGRIIWEGYMGAQEPAFLLRGTVNLEQTGSPRHEHLSTGLYTLMDVVCTGCKSPMGWQYLEASQEVSNTGAKKVRDCCHVSLCTKMFELIVMVASLLLLLKVRSLAIQLLLLWLHRAPGMWEWCLCFG